MTLITRIIAQASVHARASRARTFRSLFSITTDTRILDLGSENGSAIASTLEGVEYQARNVHIADIDPGALQDGHERYGFTPVLIAESGHLPFPDRYFDIVYCSSVIEHVTISKNEVWRLKSGREFRRRAKLRQAEMANEISRVAAQYFVQTPYKYFPIESHSCLPFLGWLPRRVLVPTLRLTNQVWVKQTGPDWYLLTKCELASLFPGATILEEKVCGLTKSLMANRTLPAQAKRHTLLPCSAG